MQEQLDSLDKEVLEAEKALWKLHAHQLNKKTFIGGWIHLSFQFCQVSLFLLYQQTVITVVLRCCSTWPEHSHLTCKSGKLLLSCSGKLRNNLFQCHLDTAAVCASPPHFSSLTQLASVFSLTAKCQVGSAFLVVNLCAMLLN